MQIVRRREGEAAKLAIPCLAVSPFLFLETVLNSIYFCLVAKLREIELGDGTIIPVIYEDRSVLAIDKPPGWMLAPMSWDRTGRNLQRALESSLLARDFWARSRNLKYLRFVHRLDAETSGVLLLAKSSGALRGLQGLFETRQMKKVYLAVVQGVPAESDWVCRLALAPDPQQRGKMRVVREARERPPLPSAFLQRRRGGTAAKLQSQVQGAKSAETHFRVLQRGEGIALVEACPVTGRTHQVRVHLAASGHPVLGEALYGSGLKTMRSEEIGEVLKRNRRRAEDSPPYLELRTWPLALRAIVLDYPDPFTGRVTHIEAPAEEFVRAFGFVRAN